MKIIGIIGTRRRNTPEDYLLVQAAFLGIYEPGDQIVSGGCTKGGDAFAELLAQQHGINPILHLPDLTKVTAKVKSTRVAYAIALLARNTLIAQDATHLIACVAPDRKGGTEDTIRKFKKLRKHNLIIV